VIAGDPSRSEVEDLMSRPEFQYPKSFMERLGDWIGERLEGLFDRLPGDTPSPSFGGGAGSLIGWLLVVSALAAVVFIIVIAVRRWVPRVADSGEELSEIETEHRRRASEWAAEANDLESRGEWKLAIRARFRELVRSLVDREQVADLPGRTTGELLADMSATTPGAVESFDTTCLLFELPWYAHQRTGPEENARFRVHAAEVLAALKEHDLHDHAAGVADTAAVGRVEIVAGDAL
jgi:hypothetical protein